MLIVSTFYRKQTASFNRVNNLGLKCQKTIDLVSHLHSVYWNRYGEHFFKGSSMYISHGTPSFHAHFVSLTTCKLSGHCSRTVSVMLNAHLIPSLPMEFFATFLLHLDPPLPEQFPTFSRFIFPNEYSFPFPVLRPCSFISPLSVRLERDDKKLKN